MHKMHQARPQFTFPDPSGGTAYALVPADLAKIYNLNPLFSAGISGQGQTIVLIEDTDVFSASDWSAFRSTLGLSGYSSASFAQVHPASPSGPNNCGAPGAFAPNDAEAILDAEWASASAPSAAIEMAACALCRHNRHVRRLDCHSEPHQRQHRTSLDREHQLWPVRNRERRGRQCCLQFRLSASCRRGRLRFRCRRRQRRGWL